MFPVKMSGQVRKEKAEGIKGLPRVPAQVSAVPAVKT